MGTLKEVMQGILGYDENVKFRPSMIPVVKNQDDTLSFGWPTAAISLAEALALPGHVAKGGSYTPQDVTNMAMNLGMIGAPVGYATAPEGALGMFSGGRKYYRRTNGSPDTGVGYMMFADDADKISGYGKNLYTVSDNIIPEKIIDASSNEFRDIARKALNKNKEIVSSYDTGQFSSLDEVIESLLNESNPDDIVNSAGIWDAPDLATLIKKEVKKKYDAVKTQDGIILFNKKNVEKIIEN